MGKKKKKPDFSKPKPVKNTEPEVIISALGENAAEESAADEAGVAG